LAATFAAGFGVAGLVGVGLAEALGAGFAAGFAAAFAVVDLVAGFAAGFAAGLAAGFGVAAFEAGFLPLSFASGKAHPAHCLQNYVPLMLFSKGSTEWFIRVMLAENLDS